MKEGRIRFKTVFVSDQAIRDPKIDVLKEWSESFQKSGLTPEVEGNYTGNLSFRFREGFVVTASGLKTKENLADDCFVYVKCYDEASNTFYVLGKKLPSSESVMHSMIYRSNEEVNAVFHGHCDLVVADAERLGLPVTENEYESGTVELAREVLKVMDSNRLIVLRNHGFVALGNSMREAGELALATLKRSEAEKS